MTTIYLMRHSELFKIHRGIEDVNESLLLSNKKRPLSINGEKLAEEMSDLPELLKVEILYSSHYVRAMSTAKYIAEKNNIILNVDERLGERRFGVNNISELPSTFFEDQFRNWDYKLTNGESVNEVSKRMNEALSEILDVNRDKKIAIISHGTAISAMLKKWCNIKLNEETKLVEIYFNNKLVFDGNWKCPELFKLEFDDNNNLISIKNIKFK